MSPHHWGVDLTLLLVIAALGIGLGITAHRLTPHYTIERDTLRWCEAPRDFVYRGTIYPAGWQFPCRWQHLEQAV